MIVSVPYRGATFLNRNKNIVGNSVRGFPSPIGELHFSIRIVNHLQVQNVFPSPIGELHFSIPSGTRPRRTHQGFRPLSGSYISQFETLNGAVYKPANVSVPYRGATFLNDVEYKEEDLQYSVSVPYRGATFLNNDLNSTDKIFLTVSVPYRGATFLNSILLMYSFGRAGFRPLSGSYISQS